MEYQKFKAIRKKVETVPWHPGAPAKEGDKMPKNCYFESHISVITDNSDQDREKIKSICKNFNAHLSNNVFKKIEGGKCVVMITLRDYALNFIEFEKRIMALNSFLNMNDIKSAGKDIVEFCIYDTKISHDYLWLK